MNDESSGAAMPMTCLSKEIPLVDLQAIFNTAPQRNGMYIGVLHYCTLGLHLTALDRCRTPAADHYHHHHDHIDNDIIGMLTRFSCEARQGTSADKLQVKASRIIPLVATLIGPNWTRQSKQDPINCGHGAQY